MVPDERPAPSFADLPSGPRVAIDALAELERETRQALQRRLQVIVGALLAVATIFTVRNLFFEEVSGTIGLNTIQVVLLIVLMAVVARSTTPRLATLRVVEVTTFLSMCIIAGSGFHGQLVKWVAEDNSTRFAGELAIMVLNYIALMAVYALFIPARWTRTLLLTGAIALTPTVTVLLVTRSAAGAEMLANVGTEQVSSLAMMLVFTVVICALGSQVISGLRLRAAEAEALGQYQLTERLGVGGMGEVWRARHRLLARPAAIKLIRPELIGTDAATSLEARRRFEREAQATALLRSAHTVELYDFGVTERGAFYYVMELLDGLSLEQLVERHGPQPGGRIVPILMQACESLGEAHAQGLIHRDVKPANLVLCRAGPELDFVKVLDFGLVTAASAGLSSGADTHKTSLAGTPAYMAPEQVLGGELDGRTDIYALGCVGYWLLTGHKLFEEPAGAAQMAMAHVQTDPELPSLRTEMEIPAQLEAVVMRCLAKDPAQRPASMDELRRELKGCGGVEPWDDERVSAWWQAHVPTVTASR